MYKTDYPNLLGKHLSGSNGQTGGVGSLRRLTGAGSLAPEPSFATRFQRQGNVTRLPLKAVIRPISSPAGEQKWLTAVIDAINEHYTGGYAQPVGRWRSSVPVTKMQTLKS